MISPPGFKERSRVSVVCQAFCDVQLKAEVPSEVFVPKPKVQGAIVRMV